MCEQSTSMVEPIGYQILEQLYASTKTLVYRCQGASDAQPVIIKLLQDEYPSFSELVQFRNQYAIASSLNLPNIIQLYRLEPYRNGYALVMEDFGGISLKQWIDTQSDRSIADFLNIAIQLAQVLEQLYQHRVIHKDIKPTNILINPQTQQVKLIDFSLASLLPRETQTIQNLNILEGTLAYISPEQTGRMNRGIDYRTDFYSLGATFYELLTGQLPFELDDPIELVHAHLAKAAPLAHQINPEVPTVLSAIVSKLMAKNAEDRYQSALGLIRDLETCRLQLRETGRIEEFEIARQDVSDRFLIPEKLYGRTAEVQTLLDAFERTAQGQSELLLVKGFSGIGKTAVINEVHKPIVRQRGYFIKGKFNQFNRNIPFWAFVQAFRELMGQLLGEPDTQLAQWRAKILQALGENAQVMIEAIPDLERIIGKQPPVLELAGSAAQNRFNLLFRKFIQVFTTANHPLVLFLDDLQWADSASLKLIGFLMAESQQGYLLILGAYRDNEVSPTHPLMRMLADIPSYNTISLAPLDRASINQLVADTLTCSPVAAQPLTEWVYQKTQGNPFFTTQFLKTLYQEGFITFDRQVGHWQCDITPVREAALTEDVVELMAQQLQKLPIATQTLLKLAACVGDPFDLATLTMISEESEATAASALWEALQEGLILPQTQVYKFYLGATEGLTQAAMQAVTYRFLHDRVQQAAYSLIPQSDRAIAHYQIGQLLLERLSPAAREERIFELVNQLNAGIDLIAEPAKRYELAQLNLSAARKARSATAYQAARDYAASGLILLGETCWQTDYAIALELHNLAAEVAWLCGDFTQMDRWIATVIEQAQTPLDRMQVYQVQLQSLNARNQFVEAIAIGTQVLQELGVDFPQTPTPEDIQQARQEISSAIGDRSIASLVDLPKMSDPHAIAIMQIADSIMPACYMSGSPLYPFVVMLEVKLSIQFGNSLFSPVGYVSYAFQLHVLWQELTLAQQFGQLAYQLAREPEAKNIRAATFNVFAGYIYHCTAHLRETLPIFHEAYQAALETGDLQFIVYVVQVFSLNAFWSGLPLNELEPQIRAYHQQLEELNRDTQGKHYHIYWETARLLLGESEAEIDLRQPSYEETLLAEVQASNDGFRLCIFYLHRFILHFWLGEIAQAQQNAATTRQHLSACVGTVVEPAFYFYDSLAILASLSDPNSEALQWQQVTANQTQLQHWATCAPMNHLHKWQLVEAERYRVLGEYKDAIELYDLALENARSERYFQEAALAYQLAAQFYLQWGKQKVAAGYLQEAYYGYARWGAKAKIAELEQRYPQLLQPILAPERTPQNSISRAHITSSSSGSSESLDLAAVIKASQAISGELLPEQLIVTLMQVVLENAGADCGCLILLKGDRLVRVAHCASGQTCQLESVPLEESTNLPISIVRYVFRTAESLAIDDLKAETQFAADPYIIQHQPTSVLCLPLIKTKQPIGVLYLENNLTAGAFSSDSVTDRFANRIRVLNVLCAQAAISFENATLYNNLQASNQSLQQSLEALQQTQTKLMQATEKLQHDAFHDALTNLPNRALFIQLLEHTIQLNQRHPDNFYAVFFIDLDRFKMINDGLGHSLGDELLKCVAQRLQECVRASDTLARFGGDEFAILLEELQQVEEAIEVARRIHAQFTLPFQVEGYEIFTAVSIGIAWSAIPYQQASHVLRDADTAMYSAKSQGRNCYAIFNPVMQTQVTARLQLEGDLRRALDAQEFCLHYQPIISLSTGRLRGFEALVRWNHPQRGMISPIEFIPVAEETRLIIPLGAWVLQEACQQLSQWLREFPQLSSLVMNVNLSVIQLKQVELLDQLETILQATGIPRHGLKLEITESCILETFTSEAQRLKQLKDLGIRLCIDDFGIGYSSLSRLHEFPIDTLKVDRSFVQHLRTHQSETVRMIITLAHSLEMDVVAEGIETDADLHRLRELGCEFGQGYWFSRPVDSQKAREWLERALD